MKILRNIAIILTILFFVWFGISWIEITSQNLDFNNPTILSSWNLFNILCQFNSQLFSFPKILPLCRPLSKQAINLLLAYGNKKCC